MLIQENKIMKKEEHNRKERVRRELDIKCRNLTIQEFMPIIITQRDSLGRFVKGGKGHFGYAGNEKFKTVHSKTMIELWKSDDFRSMLFTKTHRMNLAKARIGVKLTQSQKDAISIATKLAMQDPLIKKKCVAPHLGKKLKPESIIKREQTRRKNGWFTPYGLKTIRLSAKHNILNQIFPLKDTKPETIMQSTLKLNNIDFTKHFCIFDGKGFFHRVDILIKPNICIEIDGDYWHANPKKYTPDFILRGGITAQEKWDYDSTVNNKIEKLGYKMIRLWASDIMENPQKCAEIIIKELY